MIDSIKGKIGGTSFQLGYAGNIVKTKQKAKLSTVPKLVTRHQLKKSIYTFVSQQWRGLTDTQRTDWGTAAASFPATNRFGDVYTPSGYQLFMQFNTIAYFQNGAITTATPVPITWPSLVGFSILYLDPTQVKMDIPVTTSGNTRLEVLATAQHSQGTMVGRGGYKYLGKYETNSEGLLVLTDDYASIYQLPKVGQRVTVKCRWIDYVLGQYSPWVIVTKVSS